jgi:hypothetical protein
MWVLQSSMIKGFTAVPPFLKLSSPGEMCILERTWTSRLSFKHAANMCNYVAPPSCCDELYHMRLFSCRVSARWRNFPGILCDQLFQFSKPFAVSFHVCDICSSRVSLFSPSTHSCCMCNQIHHKDYIFCTKCLYVWVRVYVCVLPKRDFPFEYYDCFVHCRMFCWMIQFWKFWA